MTFFQLTQCFHTFSGFARNIFYFRPVPPSEFAHRPFGEPALKGGSTSKTGHCRHFLTASLINKSICFHKHRWIGPITCLFSSTSSDLPRAHFFPPLFSCISSDIPAYFGAPFFCFFFPCKSFLFNTAILPKSLGKCSKYVFFVKHRRIYQHLLRRPVFVLFLTDNSFLFNTTISSKNHGPKALTMFVF